MDPPRQSQPQKSWENLDFVHQNFRPGFKKGVTGGQGGPWRVQNIYHPLVYWYWLIFRKFGGPRYTNSMNISHFPSAPPSTIRVKLRLDRDIIGSFVWKITITLKTLFQMRLPYQSPAVIDVPWYQNLLNNISQFFRVRKLFFSSWVYMNNYPLL